MLKTFTPEDIWAEAKTAGEKAAAEYDQTLPPENSRGFDCGFAGVDIKPARGAFIQYLKSKDIGYKKTWGGGGYQLMTTWHPTQSIGTHRAAAAAVAKVLVSHGIPATVWSRYD